MTTVLGIQYDYMSFTQSSSTNKDCVQNITSQHKNSIQLQMVATVASWILKSWRGRLC